MLGDYHPLYHPPHLPHPPPAPLGGRYEAVAQQAYPVAASGYTLPALPLRGEEEFRQWQARHYPQYVADPGAGTVSGRTESSGYGVREQQPAGYGSALRQDTAQTALDLSLPSQPVPAHCVPPDQCLLYPAPLQPPPYPRVEPGSAFSQLKSIHTKYIEERSIQLLTVSEPLPAYSPVIAQQVEYVERAGSSQLTAEQIEFVETARSNHLTAEQMEYVERARSNHLTAEQIEYVERARRSQLMAGRADLERSVSTANPPQHPLPYHHHFPQSYPQERQHNQPQAPVQASSLQPYQYIPGGPPSQLPHPGYEYSHVQPQRQQVLSQPPTYQYDHSTLSHGANPPVSQEYRAPSLTPPVSYYPPPYSHTDLHRANPVSHPAFDHNRHLKDSTAALPSLEQTYVQDVGVVSCRRRRQPKPKSKQGVDKVVAPSSTAEVHHQSGDHNHKTGDSINHQRGDSIHHQDGDSIHQRDSINHQSGDRIHHETGESTNRQSGDSIHSQSANTELESDHRTDHQDAHPSSKAGSSTPRAEDEQSLVSQDASSSRDQIVELGVNKVLSNSFMPSAASLRSVSLLETLLASQSSSDIVKKPTFGFDVHLLQTLFRESQTRKSAEKSDEASTSGVEKLLRSLSPAASDTHSNSPAAEKQPGVSADQSSRKERSLWDSLQASLGSSGTESEEEGRKSSAVAGSVANPQKTLSPSQPVPESKRGYTTLSPGLYSPSKVSPLPSFTCATTTKNPRTSPAGHFHSASSSAVSKEKQGSCGDISSSDIAAAPTFDSGVVKSSQRAANSQSSDEQSPGRETDKAVDPNLFDKLRLKMKALLAGMDTELSPEKSGQSPCGTCTSHSTSRKLQKLQSPRKSPVLPDSSPSQGQTFALNKNFPLDKTFFRGRNFAKDKSFSQEKNFAKDNKVSPAVSASDTDDSFVDALLESDIDIMKMTYNSDTLGDITHTCLACKKRFPTCDVLEEHLLEHTDGGDSWQSETARGNEASKSNLQRGVDPGDKDDKSLVVKVDFSKRAKTRDKISAFLEESTQNLCCPTEENATERAKRFGCDTDCGDGTSTADLHCETAASQRGSRPVASKSGPFPDIRGILKRSSAPITPVTSGTPAHSISSTKSQHEQFSKSLQAPSLPPNEIKKGASLKTPQHDSAKVVSKACHRDAANKPSSRSTTEESPHLKRSGSSQSETQRSPQSRPLKPCNQNVDRPSTLKPSSQEESKSVVPKSDRNHRQDSSVRKAPLKEKRTPEEQTPAPHKVSHSAQRQQSSEERALAKAQPYRCGRKSPKGVGDGSDTYWKVLGNGQIFRAGSRRKSNDVCDYTNQCVIEEMRSADYDSSRSPKDLHPVTASILQGGLSCRTRERSLSGDDSVSVSKGCSSNAVPQDKSASEPKDTMKTKTLADSGKIETPSSNKDDAVRTEASSVKKSVGSATSVKKTVEDTRVSHGLKRSHSETIGHTDDEPHPPRARKHADPPSGSNASRELSKKRKTEMCEMSTNEHSQDSNKCPEAQFVHLKANSSTPKSFSVDRSSEKTPCADQDKQKTLPIYEKQGQEMDKRIRHNTSSSQKSGDFVLHRKKAGVSRDLRSSFEDYAPKGDLNTKNSSLKRQSTSVPQKLGLSSSDPSQENSEGSNKKHRHSSDHSSGSKKRSVISSKEDLSVGEAHSHCDVSANSNGMTSSTKRRHVSGTGSDQSQKMCKVALVVVEKCPELTLRKGHSLSRNGKTSSQQRSNREDGTQAAEQRSKKRPIIADQDSVSTKKKFRSVDNSKVAAPYCSSVSERTPGCSRDSAKHKVNSSGHGKNTACKSTNSGCDDSDKRGMKTSTQVDKGSTVSSLKSNAIKPHPEKMQCRMNSCPKLSRLSIDNNNDKRLEETAAATHQRDASNRSNPKSQPPLINSTDQQRNSSKSYPKAKTAPNASKASDKGTGERQPSQTSKTGDSNKVAKERQPSQTSTTSDLYKATTERQPDPPATKEISSSSKATEKKRSGMEAVKATGVNDSDVCFQFCNNCQTIFTSRVKHNQHTCVTLRWDSTEEDGDDSDEDNDDEDYYMEDDDDDDESDVEDTEGDGSTEVDADDTLTTSDATNDDDVELFMDEDDDEVEEDEDNDERDATDESSHTTVPESYNDSSDSNTESCVRESQCKRAKKDNRPSLPEPSKTSDKPRKTSSISDTQKTKGKSQKTAETLQNTKNKTDKTITNPEKTREISQNTKNKTHKCKEKAEKTRDVVDKTKDNTHKPTDKAEKPKESNQDTTKDKTEKTGDVPDNAENKTDSTKDRSKDITDKTVVTDNSGRKRSEPSPRKSRGRRRKWQRTKRQGLKSHGQLCNSSYASSKKAKDKSEKGDVMFSCDRCNQTYSSRGGLLHHVRHYHMNK